VEAHTLATKRNNDTSNNPSDGPLYDSRLKPPQPIGCIRSSGPLRLFTTFTTFYEPLRPFTTSRMLFCDASFATVVASTLAAEAEQEYIQRPCTQTVSCTVTCEFLFDFHIGLSFIYPLSVIPTSNNFKPWTYFLSPLQFVSSLAFSVNPGIGKCGTVCGDRVRRQNP